MRLVSDAFYRRHGLLIGVGRPFFFSNKIKRSVFTHSLGAGISKKNDMIFVNSMFSDTDKILPCEGKKIAHLLHGRSKSCCASDFPDLYLEFRDSRTGECYFDKV